MAAAFDPNRVVGGLLTAASALQQPFALDSLPDKLRQPTVAYRARVKVVWRDIFWVLGYLIADREKVNHTYPISIFGGGISDGSIPLLDATAYHSRLLATDVSGHKAAYIRHVQHNYGGISAF
jgi:hypothetical protein